jgi:hypothetical protein
VATAKTRIRPPASAEELLDQLGIQVSNAGDREISAHCPFHHDSHPSFSMNVETQLWTCYQCGQGGTLEMLVSMVGNVTNPAEYLRQIQLRRVKKRAVGKEPEPVVSTEQTDPFLIKARFETFKRVPNRFLDERNLRRQDVERFDIKWDKGWAIPIWAPQGDLLGWQWKRLDVVRNYPKTVKKSLTLFGLREVSGTTVVLVESPLDAVRLAGVGVTAVSSFGAFVSKAQLRLLIELADRIVLALDNDEAGQAQTKRIFPYVSRFLPTKRAQLPAKDPGEMDNEQLLEVFG